MNNDLSTLRAQLDAFEKSERARDPNADIWGLPEGQRLLAEYRKANRNELDKLTVTERFELMLRKNTTELDAMSSVQAKHSIEEEYQFQF